MIPDGKFHLEMRWHHQFHFLLWGRGHLAQRSDGYFDAVREPARQFTKHQQGCKFIISTNLPLLVTYEPLVNHELSLLVIL